MSGHVFHPGHAALHGITVVARLADGTVLVGRFHEEEQGKVHLLDVSTQPAGSPEEEAAFLERTRRFGVRVDRKHLTIPSGEIASLAPLGGGLPG